VRCGEGAIHVRRARDEEGDTNLEALFRSVEEERAERP
jgi:hypothetical protein